MKKAIAAAWRIAGPYWVSEDRWPARGLLVLIIGLDLFRVYLNVRITYWMSDFWDALVAYDLNEFWRQMAIFLVLAGVGVVVDSIRPWFSQRLEMRWRTWLTDIYLNKWLSNNAYYRMGQAGLVDNPDQRLADDLRLVTTDTLTLFFNFIQNFANLVSYSVVIWGLSGSIAFALGGMSVSIPGYLLWAAFLYALVSSIVLERVAKPMVAVDYRQQQREADFRFLLVRIRQSAEEIAFYSGAASERRRLWAAFQAIRQNWGEVMRYTKRVTFFKETYIEIGAFVAYLLILPRYFSKSITMGMTQQAILVFSRVRGSFSWFIMFYKELALLRSVYQRLIEFNAAFDAPVKSGIAVERDTGGRDLVISDLKLDLPDGSPLGQVGALTIRPGERWLVRGPSGEGKSTLLRALAGLWPHGSGSVHWPEGRVMFIPQRSYLPIGPLREVLAYPHDPAGFADADYEDVLRVANLGALRDQLGESADWARRLSLGEQQRLAFARALLQRPDFLFLDESTSALDEDNERNLYRALLDCLQGLTLVSVAHRSSLGVFHDHCLELRNGTCRRSMLEEGRAPLPG